MKSFCWQWTSSTSWTGNPLNFKTPLNIFIRVFYIPNLKKKHKKNIQYWHKPVLRRTPVVPLPFPGPLIGRYLFVLPSGPAWEKTPFHGVQGQSPQGLTGPFPIAVPHPFPGQCAHLWDILSVCPVEPYRTGLPGQVQSTSLLKPSMVSKVLNLLSCTDESPVESMVHVMLGPWAAPRAPFTAFQPYPLTSTCPVLHGAVMVRGSWERQCPEGLGRATTFLGNVLGHLVAKGHPANICPSLRPSSHSPFGRLVQDVGRFPANLILFMMPDHWNWTLCLIQTSPAFRGLQP